MNYNSITHEDKEWFSRIEDLSEAALTRKTPKFTKFCDERLLYMFKARAKHMNYALHVVWGGYRESERAIVGFFPDFIEPDPALFPLSLLRISGAVGCSHRDFLGSLLALGISRDMIGDILVCDSCAFVFLYDTVKDFVIMNLSKVASRNVTITAEEDFSVLPPRRFEEIGGTVSSVRLDSVVSVFTRKSRGDSQALINSEKVFVNYAVCTNPSSRPKEGDVISVRGFGKMQLLTIGGETKKGRIRISINKYV